MVVKADIKLFLLLSYGTMNDHFLAGIRSIYIAMRSLPLLMTPFDSLKLIQIVRVSTLN